MLRYVSRLSASCPGCNSGFVDTTFIPLLSLNQPQIENVVPQASIGYKIHCCLFCSKQYSRISRHYMQVHNEEHDVAKILIVPKKSKKRKLLGATLVNKGDYHHTYEVLQKKTGVIIPKYRSRKANESKSHQAFLPCEFCWGLYTSDGLWKHQQTCPNQTGKEIKGKARERARLLLPVIGQSTGFYEHVFVKMQQYTVKDTTESDPLLSEFGNRLFGTCGTKLHQHQYMAQRVR